VDGRHWRLVSLVELGAPAGDPRSIAAAHTVLDWLDDERRRERIPVVDGLARCHASMEGNALRYPPYWHYDVLQALLVLARMGLAADPRAADALAVVEAKRRPDGRWAAEGAWWRPPGSADSGVEVVDWGRRGPNEMITLNALRVPVAAGRAAPTVA
jgi:hypothetical protein